MLKQGRFRFAARRSWQQTGVCLLLLAIPSSFADVIRVETGPRDIGLLAAGNLQPAAGPQVFHEASRLYKAGKLPQCRERLQALQKRDASLPNPDLVVVWLLLSERRLPEAMNRLEILAASAPGDPEVSLTLGQVALSQNRLADAAVHLQKSATLTLPAAWNEQRRREYAVTLFDLLAAVYEYQGRWPEAQQVLMSLIRLNQGSIPVLIRLARAHYQLNETAAANALLEQVASLSNGAAPAPLMRAEIAFASGRMAEAETALAEALKKHENTPHVHLWHADWLLFRRNPSAALKSLDRAAELGDSPAVHAISRGQALMMLGRYAEAVTEFRKIMEDSEHMTDQRQAAATNLLVQALICTADPLPSAEAVRLAEQNALQFPADPSIVGTLGWAYFKCGRMEEAQLMLRRALELNDKVTSDLSYFLADFYSTSAEHQQETQQFLTGALESSEGVFVMQAKAGELRDRLK